MLNVIISGVICFAIGFYTHVFYTVKKEKRRIKMSESPFFCLLKTLAFKSFIREFHVDYKSKPIEFKVVTIILKGNYSKRERTELCALAVDEIDKQYDEKSED